MVNKVYILVTIDTECDKGPEWQIQRPMRFTSVIQGVPDRLTPLYRKYSIKPTYLLSPEVMQDDASVSVLASIEHCELATHLHGEFIQPQADWEATHTHTPQLLYEPQIERQKLINLTDLFKSRFGYPPKSFRAGRFGISTHTLGYLSELGYRVDSSVTPFWTHGFEGRAVRNFWGAPIQPYHPDERDVRRRGNLPILEVPVTILNPGLRRWPRWVVRKLETHRFFAVQKRLPKRLKSFFSKTVWLRPQRSSPEELVALAENVIRMGNNDRPITLNLMYHNVEIISGASPYAQTEAEVQNILDCQAYLFDHLAAHHDVESVGLGELYDRLDAS